MDERPVRRSGGPRRGARALALGIALPIALATLLGAESVAGAASLPSSLASTGDSITRAFNTGSVPYVDSPTGSWSTGTNTKVVSIYQRILAKNRAISGRNWNHAVSGARIGDLAGQLAAAATRQPDAVTVLIGANDVCASSEAAMTSVADFESRLRAALASFTTASPGTTILLASIPNVRQLWALFKDSATARSVWSLFSICQSMLANPTSTAAGDVARRQRVLDREVAYNEILARVCAEYARCRWDGGAVFATAFARADVTTRDYFHPSLAGQKKLAEVAWIAWFGR